MVLIWIAAYFGFGAFFGLATFRTRHLYSEGASRAQASASARDRALWVCIATALWPLLALTRAYGACRHALQSARR